ncbi:MAG: hypothetical protein ACRDTG_25870 [Pseudonocardiaceae bacterium]
MAEEGESHRMRGDLPAAARSFCDALRYVREAMGNPALAVAAAAAHVGLGRVYLARNSLHRAAGEFRAAQLLRPDAWQGFYWSGCAAAHQGDYPRAEWDFTQALWRVPALGPAYVQRAYVRLRLSLWNAALADLLAAARYGVLDENAALALAALQLRRGERVPAGLLTARARHTLGSLLRKFALAHAQQTRWEPAAALLVASRELAGEQAGFALLDAMVCALGNRRGAAIHILTEASRRAPTDHRLTHTLALVQLHTLSAAQAHPANASWPQCIAAWGAVLHDSAFWESFRIGAERRYRKSVEAAHIESLQRGLRALLERRLPPEADDGNVVAPSVLFWRELGAARVLGRLGGFPLSGPAGPTLVCGPLRVAELGLQRVFGAFVTGIGSPALRRGVRRWFSQLGLGYYHLTGDRPLDALEALADLRCPHCRTEGIVSWTVSRPVVCREDCPWFGAHNPAYAASGHGRDCLSDDAMALAVEALLRLGQDCVVAREMDLLQACGHWRHAISCAAWLGEHEEVQRKVADLVLGRARALERHRNLGDAITMLEATCEITGAGSRERLEGRLAKLLTIRGITTGNEDPARIDQSIDDLRRAVTVNPHFLHARLNLGKALRIRAITLLKDGKLTEAITRLREAIDHLDEGLGHIPNHAGLVAQRAKATAELDYLVTALFDAAWERRR